MSEAVADRAIEDLLFGILNGFCQSVRILLRKPYEMEGDPLGRLCPDTRYFFNLVYKPV